MATDTCLRLSGSRRHLKAGYRELAKSNRKHATMTSFLVHHKEVSQFSPPRNPAEATPLASCKKQDANCRVLRSPKRNPADGNRLKGSLLRACLKLWSALAIVSALLAGPLRAEFLYVSNVNGNSISAYQILKNGALRPIAGSPFPAAGGPAAVAVDFCGQFAYVANANSNNVSAFRITERGRSNPSPDHLLVPGTCPFP
jgi:hypothetical protein